MIKFLSEYLLFSPGSAWINNGLKSKSSRSVEPLLTCFNRSLLPIISVNELAFLLFLSIILFFYLIYNSFARKRSIAYGKKINDESMKKILTSKEEILIVFGTTDKGIHEMLKKKISTIQNFKTWNFFPDQGTETVRLEEAILGCLAILNSKNYSE